MTMMMMTAHPQVVTIDQKAWFTRIAQMMIAKLVMIHIQVVL